MPFTEFTNYISPLTWLGLGRIHKSSNIPNWHQSASSDRLKQGNVARKVHTGAWSVSLVHKAREATWSAYCTSARSASWHMRCILAHKCIIQYTIKFYGMPTISDSTKLVNRVLMFNRIIQHDTYTFLIHMHNHKPISSSSTYISYHMT